MFGGKLPKPVYRPHPAPFIKDINMPGVDLTYAHLSREPNTDYGAKLLQYNQRKEEYDSRYSDHDLGKVKQFIEVQAFFKNADKKFRQSEVQRRLEQKLGERENEINKKREKLRVLLAAEEHQYIYETIDNAQKGTVEKTNEMRQRCQQLQAKREAQRLQVVREKKLQQYMARSQEVRPILAKNHLLESKRCQLQQMRENESRRESERELDQFWYDVMMKDIETKKFREEQEAIERFNKTKEGLDILDKQIAGKKLLKQEEAKLELEDRLEWEKLQEEEKLKENDSETGVVAKKKLWAEELKKQLEEDRALKARRKALEDELDNAYIELSMVEWEHEKAKISDYSNTFKAEMMMYRKHLEQLREEKKAEEERMFYMLEEYRERVEAEQDERRCKEQLAKIELQRQVMIERAQQVEDKKKANDALLAKKEEEIEAMNRAIQMNRLLDKEEKRRQKELQDKYTQDLLKQIEYSRELMRREEAEIQRQLELGRREEEYFKKLIGELSSMDQYLGGTHPFRKELNKFACCCRRNQCNPRPF